MKENSNSVSRGKRTAVILLYTGAAMITAAGIAFSIFAAVNGVRFPVLSSEVPGVLFGGVVTFLGVRYLFSVGKLKNQVFRADSKFSWEHFRRKNGSRKR